MIDIALPRCSVMNISPIIDGFSTTDTTAIPLKEWKHNKHVHVTAHSTSHGEVAAEHICTVIE